MENDKKNQQKQYKVPSYILAAKKRWCDKNKGVLREYQKNYYHNHKYNEEFVERRRVYSREYMKQRRMVLKVSKTPSVISR